MKQLNVLVGCEFSGRVREAFRKLGHNAWSCDLLPADDNSRYHIQGNVLKELDKGWDIGIFHPPCTYLCCSGLHWNKRTPGRQEKTEKALRFVRKLLEAPIPHIALENPVGCISTRIRKPSQIIQPYEYSHPESKSTCLFLVNLPKLIPTHILSLPASGRWDNQTKSGQNNLGPSEDRWKLRSLTYAGVAQAMALQWSTFVVSELSVKDA